LCKFCSLTWSLRLNSVSTCLCSSPACPNAIIPSTNDSWFIVNGGPQLTKFDIGHPVDVDGNATEGNNTVRSKTNNWNYNLETALHGRNVYSDGIADKPL